MGSMGESGTSINATDTGVATYVGGDMLIGQRTDDDTMRNNNGDAGGGPKGSYAAEIEGATIVNGNLYAKPKKGFFTAGIVAFGSQFVPAARARILTVAGNSYSAIPGVGHHAYAWHYPAAPGLSDMSRSVVGIADNSEIDGESSDYTAAIAGGPSTVFGQQDNHDYDAVVPYSGNSNHVTWEATDALNSIPGLTNVATKDSDFSGYGGYLKELSEQLSNVQPTGTVTEGTLDNWDVNDPGQPYRRYKYNWGNSKGEASYMYAFTGLDEKLLVFTGDGESSMQVFNLDASMLNDMGGKSGVSFEFKDIPADASVVINVTGEKDVEFNNGWRFIWNYTSDKEGVDLGYTDAQEAQGRVDLSNGYWNGAGAVNGDSGKQRVAYGDYSTRASRIIWNFADATDVTINGGKAVGGRGKAQNIQNGGGRWGYGGAEYEVESTDDPAAAFMGSILVPDGSFESHVTTNGRVWVNGDYSMYNPDASHSPDHPNNVFINNAGQRSSSVIDMDQERHNLPWSGNYVTGCAVIQWSKTDENDQPLSGTTWGIYASGDASAKPLTTVSDNGAGDLDADGGSLRVGGLNPNATYYIRETKAPDGYSLNTKVYTVTAGDAGEDNAATVTGDDGEGSPIRNTPSSVSWTKTDKDDPGHHPGGSEWTLSLTGDDGSTLSSWTVTDIGDTATQCTPDGTRLCDANHEPGDITVNKLPDGQYTLTETRAPDGYVKSNNEYSFTITFPTGKAEWDDSASADGASIPNERRTGSIAWTKTSSESSDLRLPGSEWMLTKIRDFAWGADGKATYVTIGSTIVTTVTDCTGSCATGTDPHDADSDAGGFRIEGLAWGVYKLVESKAPDGYDLDPTVRTITIGPGGVTAAIGNKSTGVGDAFSWDLGDIENSPGATLPDTGGPGRDAMLPAGVALTLIALLGLAARTARRRA